MFSLILHNLSESLNRLQEIPSLINTPFVYTLKHDLYLQGVTEYSAWRMLFHFLCVCACVGVGWRSLVSTIRTCLYSDTSSFGFYSYNSKFRTYMQSHLVRRNWITCFSSMRTDCSVHQPPGPAWVQTEAGNGK